MSGRRPEPFIRRADVHDVPGVLALRERLAFTGSQQGGFLLGTDGAGYYRLFAGPHAWVLEDRGTVVGVAIVLDDAQFRQSDVFERRDQVQWRNAHTLEQFIGDKLAYYEQLGVDRGPYRRWGAALAFTALLDAVQTADAVVTTTVKEPVNNEAAVPYIRRVGGVELGQIDEVYPQIGRLVSTLWLIQSRGVNERLHQISRLAERWIAAQAQRAVGGWRWQLQHQIRDLSALERAVDLTEDERKAVTGLADRFRLGITPYYAALIGDEPTDPLRIQAIPTLSELVDDHSAYADPLAEDAHQVVPGLTVRHIDRALLYTTHTCAVYCRHCTRRRKVSDPSSAVSKRRRQDAVAWLSEHPEIHDIVLSGGDPLSLSNAQLDHLLGALRGMDHPVTLRIGTRHPTALPMRFEPGLCAVLEKHAPIYLMTHFNHPAEATPQAERALRAARRAGCVVLNQAVLLRGVNDNAETLLELHRWLARHGVKPYRLFVCDQVEGTAHLRTPIRQAIDLDRALRHHSGILFPEVVVDLPTGAGKARVCTAVADGDLWRFEGAHTVWLTDDGQFVRRA